MKFEVSLCYFEKDGLTVKQIIEFNDCEDKNVIAQLTWILNHVSQTGIKYAAKGVTVYNFDGSLGLQIFTWSLDTKCVPDDYDFSKAHKLKYWLFVNDSLSRLDTSVLIEFSKDFYLHKLRYR